MSVHIIFWISTACCPVVMGVLFFVMETTLAAVYSSVAFDFLGALDRVVLCLDALGVVTVCLFGDFSALGVLGTLGVVFSASGVLGTFGCLGALGVVSVVGTFGCLDALGL